MKKLFIVFLVLVGIISVFFRASAGNAEEEISQEVLDYFLEVALNTEYGNRQRQAIKWTKDVRLRIKGQPTWYDLVELGKVIAEINEIIKKSGIEVEVAEDDEYYNVEVHFVPEKKFAVYTDLPEEANGFTTDWYDEKSGEIEYALVLIASDVPQDLRYHIIREEVTQMMGLLNDSWKYQDSIFYQGYSEVREYSWIDRELIRILYDPRVLPGMSEEEVREIFSSFSESSDSEKRRVIEGFLRLLSQGSP